MMTSQPEVRSEVSSPQSLPHRCSVNGLWHYRSGGGGGEEVQGAGGGLGRTCQA